MMEYYQRYWINIFQNTKNENCANRGQQSDCSLPPIGHQLIKDHSLCPGVPILRFNIVVTTWLGEHNIVR